MRCSWRISGASDHWPSANANVIRPSALAIAGNASNAKSAMASRASAPNSTDASAGCAGDVERPPSEISVTENPVNVAGGSKGCYTVRPTGTSRRTGAAPSLVERGGASERSHAVVATLLALLFLGTFGAAGPAPARKVADFIPHAHSAPHAST